MTEFHMHTADRIVRCPCGSDQLRAYSRLVGDRCEITCINGHVTVTPEPVVAIHYKPSIVGVVGGEQP